MLVLLPPSEAKSPGGSGPPAGARPSLSTPRLAGARATLVQALRRGVQARPAELVAGLKLPPGRADAALAANAEVASAPTMPALDRYAGVVFAALDTASLRPAARERALASVLVLSGLWGVVRGGDLVPDYRVPAGGYLPGVGALTPFWRACLAGVLPEVVADEPVLDLRSTDYRALWRPAGALRDQVVAVRVLAERPDGQVSPVSHHAKSVKGRVVRHLVSGRRRHHDPMAALDDAADALRHRMVDTSTRTGRSADLIGPPDLPVRRGSRT